MIGEITDFFNGEVTLNNFNLGDLRKNRKKNTNA